MFTLGQIGPHAQAPLRTDPASGVPPGQGVSPSARAIPFGGLYEAPHGVFASPETLLLPCGSALGRLSFDRGYCRAPSRGGRDLLPPTANSELSKNEPIVPGIGPFASNVYRNHHWLTYAASAA